MQFTVVAHSLRLFDVRVIAGDTPDIRNSLALGQKIDEVSHTAGMEEFLDARVRVFRTRGLHSVFLRLRVSVARLGFGRLVRGCAIRLRHVCGIVLGIDFQHFIDGFVTGFGNVFIDDGDFQSRYQEAGLTYAVDQLVIAEFGGVVKNLGIGPVTDAGSRSLRSHLADDLEFGRTVLPRLLERRIRGRMRGILVGVHTRMALVEGHVMRFAVTIYFHVETGAQCIHHGRANAMQAT